MFADVSRSKKLRCEKIVRRNVRSTNFSEDGPSGAARASQPGTHAGQQEPDLQFASIFFGERPHRRQQCKSFTVDNPQWPPAVGFGTSWHQLQRRSEPYA